jgi:hypothetical protein
MIRRAFQRRGLAENSRWQAPRRHWKTPNSGISPQRGDRKQQPQRSRTNSLAVPRTQRRQTPRRLRPSVFGPPKAPNVVITQVGTQSLYKNYTYEISHSWMAPVFPPQWPRARDMRSDTAWICSAWWCNSRTCRQPKPSKSRMTPFCVSSRICV